MKSIPSSSLNSLGISVGDFLPEAGKSFVIILYVSVRDCLPETCKSLTIILYISVRDSTPEMFKLSVFIYTELRPLFVL